MVYENKSKKSTGVVIAIFVIVAVFILLYFLLGLRGLLNIFKWLFIILFALAILGTVFYFVWFLFFKKQKYDVTFVNKQKLVDACHKGYSKILKGLYISGDKSHSRIFWGHITGWCRISVMYKELVYEKDKNGDLKPKTILNEKTGIQSNVYEMRTEEQDVFSVTHANNWFTRLFSDDDVVRVSPKEHDELVGDVTLMGFSLIPVSEYWFLNNDYLDINKIDVAILTEAKRGIMFEMLRDTKEIVDKASGLDSNHQKRIEEKSLYELPINMGNSGGNR